jgi:acyl-coenzyme A thioesterase PaaI-like protein
MDFDGLRAGLNQAIPYNRHIGLEVTELSDGRGVVRLPESDGLLNHVGSQHAGALFSAAEAASGAAFAAAFAERLAEITPLAKGARIDYLKIAKGPIDATGTLGEAKDDLLARLDADGKVEFTVDVELADAEGIKVAAMSVDWHVRAKSA